MPKAPSWYARIPDIVAHLSQVDAPPLLDRTAIERMFDLRRRQAIRLLHAADGYQVGKTFIVERRTFVDFLKGLERSGAPRQTRARKARIAAALNEVVNHAEAQRVVIRPHACSADAIEVVAPGKLQISYDGPEDLLARLVELASAAAHDFPAFRHRYGGKS